MRGDKLEFSKRDIRRVMSLRRSLVYPVQDVHGQLASCSDWYRSSVILRCRFAIIFGVFAFQSYLQAATWTITGPLHVARDSHTATLLTNGLVLVAGGYGIGGFMGSAELYDPATAVWTTNGSLNLNTP